MGNRNNNASLFHQLINAPGLMERQDLSQPVSFQTKENYCNWCHKAAAVFKSYGIRNLSEIGKDEIQRYETQLEAEGKFYDREVAVLDTIDNVARRTFTRTVYADSLIRVGSLRDTARLRIAVDVQPGEYELRLKYLVDSLDRNEKGLRGVVWLENRDGGRSSVYSTTLRRNRTENFTRRFTVDTTHRRLHLDFLDFREKPLRPSVTVTGLEIDYIPTTSVAVDSLYRQQLDLRIFADEFLRAAIQADSL